MNYTTVYVGMDVHKETFTLCCYTNEKEKAEYPQKVNGHYSKVLNYINSMRKHYGDDAVFVCGNPCYHVFSTIRSIQVNPRSYKLEVITYCLNSNMV